MNDDRIHEMVNRWMRLDDGQFLFARSAISDRLTKGETVEDVMLGGAYLAARRAEAFFNRRPGPADLEFALSIFTWWPFKPVPPEAVEERLLVIRRRVVENVRLEGFQVPPEHRPAPNSAAEFVGALFETEAGCSRVSRRSGSVGCRCHREGAGEKIKSVGGNDPGDHRRMPLSTRPGGVAPSIEASRNLPFPRSRSSSGQASPPLSAVTAIAASSAHAADAGTDLRSGDIHERSRITARCRPTRCSRATPAPAAVQ